MRAATTCSCGEPATHTVSVGHHLRGTTWHRLFAQMCGECEYEARVERAGQRAS